MTRAWKDAGRTYGYRARPLDYDRATARARELWTRDVGRWAEDATGADVDLWSPAAVTFSRAGAIIRALEEQTGRGRCTSRQYTTIDKRLPLRRS